MSRTLIQLMLEAHRDASRASVTPWRVRADHVVLDQRDGTFALGAFRTTGQPMGAKFALLALDASGVHPGALPSDDLVALERSALEQGLHVARSGWGDCGHVYTERFAAPGRLALGSASGLALAGALGMLPLRATRLEIAAALAGTAHAMMPPVIEAVRLEGGPGLGISGHDIAIELGRRLRPGRRERVIEACGPGVERLAMRHRFAIAADAATLGSTAVVFPSDEVTHSWLRSQGRDADWKRSPSDLEITAELELELETLEPWLQRPGEPEAIRAVRHAAGTPVCGVIVGPHASYADWAALAACVRGLRVDERVACVVVPGSRRILDTARAQGILAELIEAGVRVAAAAPIAARSRAEGAVLQYALGELDEAYSTDDVWRASLESCAAAALTGRITDPREIAMERAMELEPEAYAIEHDGIAAPPPSATPDTPPPWRPVSKRGVVVLRVDDDFDTARMVPQGPRLQALPVTRIAELVLATVAPGFAARAADSGAAWLLAGRRFLCGARPDVAAWMLARVGVRGVIARGYADGATTALVQAGILPLQARASAERGFEPGDELEMPGGFEALEPSIPVTVRNLTRGTQFLLDHFLDAHATTTLKAGGILSRPAVPV